jgi:prophage maintenance system killer protein
MNFLFEIAIDYFGWVLGKKSQDEFSNGNTRKGYILLTVFLALVAIMGVYSLIWIIRFIKQ